MVSDCVVEIKVFAGTFLFSEFCLDKLTFENNKQVHFYNKNDKKNVCVRVRACIEVGVCVWARAALTAPDVQK